MFCHNKPLFRTRLEGLGCLAHSVYCLISLLSAFKRIFRKIMYHKLMAYLETNGVPCDSQYGFREKHSNEHALIDIVNQVQCHFDKEMLSCGVFIDLKKALDTTDHCILLQKLYLYGIRGSELSMIGSIHISLILFNQLKLVQVSTKPTTCGIHQESILGPTLFLLYINNLCTSSHKLLFYLFADDTTLLCADRDINSLERVVNAKLPCISRTFLLKFWVKKRGCGLYTRPLI